MQGGVDNMFKVVETWTETNSQFIRVERDAYFSSDYDDCLLWITEHKQAQRNYDVKEI